MSAAVSSPLSLSGLSPAAGCGTRTTPPSTRCPDDWGEQPNWSPSDSGPCRNTSSNTLLRRRPGRLECTVLVVTIYHTSTISTSSTLSLTAQMVRECSPLFVSCLSSVTFVVCRFWVWETKKLSLANNFLINIINFILKYFQLSKYSFDIILQERGWAIE